MVLDIDAQRVAKINAGQTTVADAEVEFFLRDEELSLTATQDLGDGYKDGGIAKCSVWASSSFLLNLDPIFKLNAGDHVSKQ